MKTYCPSCGQVNEWSGIKPTECEFCSKPFIKKIIAIKKPIIASKTIVHKTATQEIVENTNQEDFDIPQFQIRAEGEVSSKSVIIDEDFIKQLKSNGPVQREEGNKELIPFKNKVIEKMLTPNIR